jgi:hypothetical protein
MKNETEGVGFCWNSYLDNTNLSLDLEFDVCVLVGHGDDAFALLL